jgi:hypothetical protein
MQAFGCFIRRLPSLFYDPASGGWSAAAGLLVVVSGCRRHALYSARHIMPHHPKFFACDWR